MIAQLVSITSPMQTLRSHGGEALSPEELIVYCARVSSPQNQANTLSATRLLRYLVEHGHWSPFEMVDMTVEVETSRAIAAQILRHWSFSYQEYSQRYAQAALGFEIYPARLQSEKNRQGSDAAPVDAETASWWRDLQETHFAECQARYEQALQRGLARELARMLLPLATRTRLYMKGDVRSWMHYLKARTAHEAQAEHRLLAEEILTIFRQKFPHTAAAFFGSVDSTARKRDSA